MSAKFLDDSNVWMSGLGVAGTWAGLCCGGVTYGAGTETSGDAEAAGPEVPYTSANSRATSLRAACRSWGVRVCDFKAVCKASKAWRRIRSESLLTLLENSDFAALMSFSTSWCIGSEWFGGFAY